MPGALRIARKCRATGTFSQQPLPVTHIVAVIVGVMMSANHNFHYMSHVPSLRGVAPPKREAASSNLQARLL